MFAISLMDGTQNSKTVTLRLELISHWTSPAERASVGLLRHGNTSHDAARMLIAGLWQYRDRIGRSRKPREAVMPSKKPTSLSTKRAQVQKAARSCQSTEQAKPPTKKQQLIDLLTAEKPVAVETIGKTLCWQPHTVRATISGLRKAGFAVDNSRPSDGGGTCYRIVGQPQVPRT